MMVCPICKNEVLSQNRLVTDSCGHIKCLKCLLSEISSCSLCVEQPSVNPDNNKVQIIDNIVIKSIDSPEAETQPKKLKIKDCEHIIKELDFFKCKVCNKKFRSRNQKYYHLYCASKNFPYKCDICVKGFSTSYHLKYHLESHKSDLKIECDLCSLKFLNIITLQNHKLKIHQNNRDMYNCDVCKKSYKEKSYYLDHLNKHNNLFPYSCDKCEKRFSSKSNLFQHKHYENEDKKYECNNCNKTFYRKSSLNNHYKFKHFLNRENKKYSQYQCTECFQNFRDKFTFTRHQNVHNAEVYYQCELCSLTTVRKDNLSRHIKNMHPNENLTNSINIIKNNKIKSKEKSPEPLPIIEEQIKITSSVIRSVGNAKPLSVENHDEFKLKSDEKCDNDISNNSDKLVAINKKIKKKYDPTEIYRKILFAGSDDSNETNEFEVVSKDFEQKSENNELIKTSTDISNECTPLSKFSEKHWRKNFTYNYNANL